MSRPANFRNVAALRPRALVINEAARYIGRGRNFIYELAARKKVRLIKSGNRSLVILDDLDAYVDSCPLAVVKPPARAAWLKSPAAGLLFYAVLLGFPRPLRKRQPPGYLTNQGFSAHAAPTLVGARA